jgi:hypothetical protein
MEVARKCNKCRRVQQIEAFEPAKRYRGGRMPVCRSCRADYRAALHERAKADPGNSKTCRKCRERLPIDEFSRDKRSPDGHAPRCKNCRREWRRAEDPRSVKDRFLRWRFGIGLDEYEGILAGQGGGCAICGNGNMQTRRKFLDVDHDHETGKVRGILCSPCNTALGLLREDPTRIARLAEYVRLHGGI